MKSLGERPCCSSSARGLLSCFAKPAQQIVQMVNSRRLPQCLTDIATTKARLDALIRSRENLLMSACTRCGLEPGQNILEMTDEGRLGEPSQSVRACKQCGAPSQLMALSEAARTTAHEARARARLSAIWVLTVLVITCALSLISLYHPGSKQEQIPVLSEFSNLTLQAPAN